MIRKEFLFHHVLLLCVVSSVGYSQEPGSAQPAHPSKAPTSAPTKKAGEAGDRVVIKVGNVQVTQAEFESRIEDLEPENDPDKGGDLEKGRRKLGDDYASVLMLSQQAVAEHLDASPEIARQLAIARLQILSDAQFAKLQERAKPTMQEVSDYYSAHLADFDRVQIRRLFIWKVGGGSKNTHGLAPQVARERADAILRASESDANKLAEAFRDSDQGQIDSVAIPYSREGLPPKMEKAAFAAKKGQWAEADDTADSIILLQLSNRDRRPLGEVSSFIEQRLQAQKMQAQLDNLKKKAGIWIDEEYFGPAEARRSSYPPASKLEKSAVKTGDN